MKKFILTKEQKTKLHEIYKDYIKQHKNEKDKLLKSDENGNEMYDVTLESCAQICELMIRIPTEFWFGEKVHPRKIDEIHSYSLYEKMCLFEILKEYPCELSDYISAYLKKTLNYK